MCLNCTDSKCFGECTKDVYMFVRHRIQYVYLSKQDLNKISNNTMIEIFHDDGSSTVISLK